jgi:hypothetical protein
MLAHLTESAEFCQFCDIYLTIETDDPQNKNPKVQGNTLGIGNDNEPHALKAHNSISLHNAL